MEWGKAVKIECECGISENCSTLELAIAKHIQLGKVRLNFSLGSDIIPIVFKPATARRVARELLKLADKAAALKGKKR